jgi:hypothetical protein
MNTECNNCGAKMWIVERSPGLGSTKRDPKFQPCCSKGSFKLQPLKPTPSTIAKLLTETTPSAKEFQTNIRVYNSALSFVSLGVKLDHNLATSRSTGNYTFRIQGSAYHLIGSALPDEEQGPKYSQIYIYDAANELNNRRYVLEPCLTRNFRRVTNVTASSQSFRRSLQVYDTSSYGATGTAT